MTTSPTPDVAASLRARILMLGDSPEQMMEFMNGITPLLAESADIIEHQAKTLSEAGEQIAELIHGVSDQREEAEYHAEKREEAEARLAEFKSEAMKVIEPFGRLATQHDELRKTGECHSWIQFLTDFYWPSEGNCVAARAFINAEQEPSDAS